MDSIGEQAGRIPATPAGAAQIPGQGAVVIAPQQPPEKKRGLPPKTQTTADQSEEAISKKAKKSKAGSGKASVVKGLRVCVKTHN